MPFTPDEVTKIMAHIREGEVTHATCASRYIMKWGYVNGQWHLSDWQEGTSVCDGSIAEDEMRANIAAADDAAFAHIVRR